MELMIVVMIIGILAVIAVPTYQNSVDRTYRNDAQAALIAFAANMERRYTENNHYCDNATGATTVGCGGVDDTGTPRFFSAVSPTDATAGQQGYDLTITAADASSFLLTATRANRMVGDECGDFTYTSTGVKGQTNNTETCW